jgi:hypothetical protein
MTDKRERRMRRLMEATGENTKSGAIDQAMKHYLIDLENKRDLIEELPPEHADALSTGPMPVTVDASVGSE